MRTALILCVFIRRMSFSTSSADSTYPLTVMECRFTPLNFRGFLFSRTVFFFTSILRKPTRSSIYSPAQEIVSSYNSGFSPFQSSGFSTTSSAFFPCALVITAPLRHSIRDETLSPSNTILPLLPSGEISVVIL